LNLGGLGLDRTPPLQAPLGLFWLLPPFLVAAGVLLAWHGETVMASRWTPAALALTHVVVLGVLAPVMCGALLQILPVLLGAPLRRPRLVAAVTGTGLALGTAALAAGFLSAAPTLLLLGGGSVAAALAGFAASALLALRHPRGDAVVRWTVRLALTAVLVTIGLGLLLVLLRLGWLSTPEHLGWANLHASWGLAGWIGALVGGMALELVPMFYLAPPFPEAARLLLPSALAVLLVAASVLTASGQAQGLPLVGLALLGTLGAFAVAALLAEHRRARAGRDACLWLWQAGQIGILSAFVAWCLDAPAPLLGTAILGSVLLIVVGTLTKILPFLGWLDLQQRRSAAAAASVRLPTMNALLPPRAPAMLAALLSGAVLAGLAAATATPMAIVSGLLLVIAGLLLARSLRFFGQQRRRVCAAIDGSI
jgi:hypothetical protein